MSNNYSDIPGNTASNGVLSVNGLSGTVVLPWKLAVTTFSTLPASGNAVGDTALTEDTNIIYAWNGSAWTQTGTANVDSGDPPIVYSNGQIIDGGGP